MNTEQRTRLSKLSSSNVSDAMEALGFVGATYGICPLYESCPKIVGEVITIKVGPTGQTSYPPTHLCVEAINSAKPGDIILIDNGGNPEVSAWGGLLAAGAKSKGLAGVAIDGVARDVDDYVELQFPVYARGGVVRTSKGRLMQYEVNGMIQFGGLQVRPGDIVVGDRSGIAIIPKERFEEVLVKAEAICQRETDMTKEYLEGNDLLEVDAKYGFFTLIKK